MKADVIKKHILEKKAQKQTPVEQAEIYGIQGWLYRATSYQMESWREISNSKDDNMRKLGPAKLIQISFRDDDGNNVFEEIDLPIIGGILDSEINRVFKRALAINGYGGEGIESILKNLLLILGADGLYDSLVSIGYQCPNCSKDTQNTNSESSGSASNTGLSEKPQTHTKESSQAISQGKK